MLAQMSGSKNNEGKKNSDEKQQCPGLHKQLRKTKLCVHHLHGGCNFGDECSFAHSLTELQSTPDLRKTQLCKAFLEGMCQDPNCDFAHADTELRSNLHFFKKALCVWHEKGKCRHGIHCRFAHGMRELRSEDAYGLDAVGAEATLLAAQGHTLQHDNNVSSSKGKKSAGSSCSSVSHRSTASTTSGSSGRPSGRGEFSDSKSDSSRSGSYAIDPQVEPMKVLQFDSRSQVGITSLAANMPLQQARMVASMTTQSGPANMPTHAYGRPSQRELDLLHESLAVANMTTQSGVVNTPTRPYDRLSHMELDVLRESIAVLTMRCLRLQERVNMGDDGPPGVRLQERVNMGDDGPPGVFWNKDSQGLPQSTRPCGYPAHALQVPSHVARGFPN